jgi:hypothetical protein
MNHVMQIAQQAHDHRLPFEDDEAADVAADAWLFDQAEVLVRGSDVVFQRRFRAPQGVPYSVFATAVQAHLNQRQIDGADDEDHFAQLVIDAAAGAPCKTAAALLLGESTHTHGKLYEIAESLLKPLVDDAIIAMAEDEDL